jgi:protein-tyrosine phosphatase
MASKIINKLYISNAEFVNNIKNIKKLRISHIVCILNNIELKEIQKHDGIKYLFICAKDKSSEYLYLHFKNAANFIEEAIQNGFSVLVHCFAGISRSPTIVAAYLIIKQKMSVTNALSCILLSRKCIQPNNGFMRQLYSLEKEQILKK